MFVSFHLQLIRFDIPYINSLTYCCFVSIIFGSIPSFHSNAEMINNNIPVVIETTVRLLRKASKINLCFVSSIVARYIFHTKLSMIVEAS